MVTEKGQVKRLDFGLAKLTERAEAAEDGPTETVGPQTEEGAIVGTVAYMLPEQAEGKKVDARSDIFSFGSVLYEMVTGQRPFQGETKLATLTAILHKEPHPIKGPPELERIVARCLRKDPARRSQHMDDVKNLLQELKEGIRLGQAGGGGSRCIKEEASARAGAGRRRVCSGDPGGRALVVLPAPAAAATPADPDPADYGLRPLYRSGAIARRQAAGLCLGPRRRRQPRHLGEAGGRRRAHPAHHRPYRRSRTVLLP